jgi:hypothetical protein
MQVLNAKDVSKYYKKVLVTEPTSTNTKEYKVVVNNQIKNDERRQVCVISGRHAGICWKEDGSCGQIMWDSSVVFRDLRISQTIQDNQQKEK